MSICSHFFNEIRSILKHCYLLTSYKALLLRGRFVYIIHDFCQQRRQVLQFGFCERFSSLLRHSFSEISRVIDNEPAFVGYAQVKDSPVCQGLLLFDEAVSNKKFKLPGDSRGTYTESF